MNMQLMVYYLYLVVAYHSLLIKGDENCYNVVPSLEDYLGTKTPYRIVSNKSFEQINYAGCTPSKVWMLIRHGTRNPSESDITKMIYRLPQVKKMILKSPSLPNEYISNRDIDLFQIWKPKLDVDDKKKLVHEGEEEMLVLAERMQSRFPKIFDAVYSNSSYKFKFTLSQRTRNSAYYFAAGLFGRQTVKDVWFPDPPKYDPILRFYKLCTKWVNEVKNKEKRSGEQLKFKSGKEMQTVVKQLNDRLGLEEDLDTDDILTIYMTCAFETAWNKKRRSPWCSLFTIDDFKVLEYYEDLEYYWRDGYGHKLSYQQACPAFGDMINFLENERPFPKASVYFTHSGTMLKMLAHLGLYKDESDLAADNFIANINRKWKTSKIDSFGNNLAFILFRCGNETKILTMHQENIVMLPSCPKQDICDIQRVKDYYQQSLESCDFNQMCGNSS